MVSVGGESTNLPVNVALNGLSILKLIVTNMVLHLIITDRLKFCYEQ